MRVFQWVGEGWQWITVFQTLVWICFIFSTSSVPSLDCSDIFEFQDIDLHCVWLTTYLKQGFSHWSMHKITWKAWQYPDCKAPPTEIQIQWIWSGLENWHFWQTPKWCCCCLFGDHTLSSSGPKEVPNALTISSCPLAQIEYVCIRRTQCDLFSFWV